MLPSPGGGDTVPCQAYVLYGNGDALLIEQTITSYNPDTWVTTAVQTISLPTPEVCEEVHACRDKPVRFTTAVLLSGKHKNGLAST